VSLTDVLLVALAATALLAVGLVVGQQLGMRATRSAGDGPSAPPDASPVDTDEAPEEDPEDPVARDGLAHALDSVAQGVILFDGQGRELFRNRTARRFAEARDPLVLVESAVAELLEGALRGRSERREVDLFGPPAQSFVVKVHPAGVPGVGALALVDDRSLSRRTETVRRDFVANISHELKTPIGALGLLAETIRDEPDGEVVTRLAERMIVEADRAGRTVDDLLELSRIEFGDEADVVEVGLASVVGEACARIAPAAEHAGIEVRTDVPAELRVEGDRRQLVSALFNLLDNAVKYSPEGGEVVVQGSSAAPDGDEGPAVLVTVSDTGIGIPRRDLDRVFERFYRVDRARSRRTGGTGLGLAIVRHVMSNHGGRVSVESTEGVGSVFTLTLPGGR
jgi:two-component system sensor histidine kinase SenX3